MVIAIGIMFILLIKLLDIPKKLKEFRDEHPGGIYVAISLWVISSIRLYVQQPVFDLEFFEKVVGLFLGSSLLTIVLYHLGSSLDPLLYGRLFSPKTDEYPFLNWVGSPMRKARLRAAWFIETGEKELPESYKPTKVEGTHKKAEALYNDTPKWKKQRKWVEASKAFRTLIIPCFLVAVYYAWLEFWPKWTQSDSLLEVLTFLPKSWTPYVFCALACILFLLYVRYRLRHVKELYNLVISEDSRFEEARLQKKLPFKVSEELFGKGCLFLITESEFKRIFHKDCSVQKVFTELLSESLEWTAKTDTPAPLNPLLAEGHSREESRVSEG